MVEPKIYVADIAAYNEGKLIGSWLEINDYNDADELMDAIQDLVDEWSEEQGVEREEWAIHDHEGIPSNLAGEYMGQKDFEAIYEMKDKAEETGLPYDVIEEWMAHTGNDSPERIEDAFMGSFESEDDWVYDWVDEGLVTPSSHDVYVSDTDRRIIASEEEGHVREDMEYENEHSDEPVYTDEEIEEAADARYDEWYKGLEDPYNFLVEEQGMYSEEDIKGLSFVQIDYKKVAQELNWDFTTFEMDGTFYVFSNNYAKGGSVKKSKRYSEGGDISSSEDWSVTNIENATHLGILEFQDDNDEWHNFEVMETEERLVFGGFSNSGFIESGYIEKDGFSTDETLQALLEDLEVYYNQGLQYTSGIVVNERMAKGGSVKKSKRGWAMDRQWTSQEPHEQRYKSKRKSKVKSIGKDRKLDSQEPHEIKRREGFAKGGRVSKNEDVLSRFLNSNDEVNTKNLSTHYSTLGAVVLLRNYGTIIAKRKGKKVYINSTKYSMSTTTITNALERMAKSEGFKISHIAEDKFAKGGSVESDISHYKVNGETFIDYMDAISYCDKNNCSYDEIIKTKKLAKGGKIGTSDIKDISVGGLRRDYGGGYGVFVVLKDGTKHHIRGNNNDLSKVKNAPVQHRGIEKTMTLREYAIDKINNGYDPVKKTMAKGGSIESDIKKLEAVIKNDMISAEHKAKAKVLLAEKKAALAVDKVASTVKKAPSKPKYKTVKAPSNKEVSSSEINEFAKYVSEFYGKKGLYAKDYNGGFTSSQIEKAIKKYVSDPKTKWGGGDSMDRELMRDKYLIPLFPKKAKSVKAPAKAKTVKKPTKTVKSPAPLSKTHKKTDGRSLIADIAKKIRREDETYMQARGRAAKIWRGEMDMPTGVTVKRSLVQNGKSNKKSDKKRKALHAGKRVSKSGRVYYESRKNRSDEDRRKKL